MGHPVFYLFIQSISNSIHIAVKYMGVQNGFEGGNLLNLVSNTELNHQIKPVNELLDERERSSYVFIKMRGHPNKLSLISLHNLPRNPHPIPPT